MARSSYASGSTSPGSTPAHRRAACGAAPTGHAGAEAAWRLQRGAAVSEVAETEGWSSAGGVLPGVPPGVRGTTVARRRRRLPADCAQRRPFPPAPSRCGAMPIRARRPGRISPSSSSCTMSPTPQYLIGTAGRLSEQQWAQDVSPGQVVLDWDGPSPASLRCSERSCGPRGLAGDHRGPGFPSRDATGKATAEQLAAHHDVIGKRWTTLISSTQRQDVWATP